MSDPMPHHLATFTVDSTEVGHLYYFAPAGRAPEPYVTQIHVQAIVDVAFDGTLTGVELIGGMPPPPTNGRLDVVRPEIAHQGSIPAGYLREAPSFAEADPDIKLKARLLANQFSEDQALAAGVIGAAMSNERVHAYDRGRRNMLNAILALNPDVAQRLHDMTSEDEQPFTNEHGQIPFDVVFWVAAVAEQLGIEPKEAEDV